MTLRILDASVYPLAIQSAIVDTFSLFRHAIRSATFRLDEPIPDVSGLMSAFLIVLVWGSAGDRDRRPE